jgi:hypothetical protein
MSKGARFVILGEDTQHLVFARRFLIEIGLANNREITVLPTAAGQGSGEQWVRERFPAELKAVRRRSTSQRVALLVLIDGDTQTPAERNQQLSKACVARAIAPPNPTDPVAVFVPRRNIDTWIRFLAGTAVNETDSYRALDRERECRESVRTLAGACRERQLPAGVPSSLREACDEFNRIVRV